MGLLGAAMSFVGASINLADQSLFPPEFLKLQEDLKVIITEQKEILDKLETIE